MITNFEEITHELNEETDLTSRFFCDVYFLKTISTHLNNYKTIC
jgi:hypothetical protein